MCVSANSLSMLNSGIFNLQLNNISYGNRFQIIGSLQSVSKAKMSVDLSGDTTKPVVIPL